jgi:hypothetical protein
MKTLYVTLVLLLVGPPTSPPPEAAQEKQNALIARSKVWLPTNVPSMDLWRGPQGDGAFEPGATITCEYVEKKMSGASPKFACRLPDGDELKVKYGGENGEVYGEVVASRLLWALGFGADRMYSVKVVCRGCPEKVAGVINGEGDHILNPAAVERKLPGKELVDRWKWEVLDQADEKTGGATKAERDALKLLAVLIQHSDSKPDQQRIICLDQEEADAASCTLPLMMINDLGITFGRANTFNQQPRGSMNLADWAAEPVWKDDASCVGNLSGSFTGTLKEPVISEEGRKFLSDLSMQLSDRQLRDMFAAGRVHLRPRDAGDGRSGFPGIDEWVNAFKQKRAQIAERRCGT